MEKPRIKIGNCGKFGDILVVTPISLKLRQ
jgi:hypothetical protein